MDPPYSFRCYFAEVEKERKKEKKRDLFDETKWSMQLSNVNDLYLSLRSPQASVNF